MAVQRRSAPRSFDAQDLPEEPRPARELVPSAAGSAGDSLSLAWRFALISLAAVLQSLLYLWLNRSPLGVSQAHTRSALDAYVPFWPWSTWPYLLLLALEFLLPLLVRQRSEIRRLLLAYAGALAVAVAIQAAWPTHRVRPELPLEPGLGALAYRRLVHLDRPECSFPSIHVLVPLIAAWSLQRDRGWRWPLVLVLALVPSVVTTAQHYLLDVLGAATLALVALFLTRASRRTEIE
jgi:membrane-associated phospholipid phosphatase